MNGRLTVLLLAGSRGPDDPVARARGVPSKALAPIGGMPMLDRVVETLQRQSRIGRILLVADTNPDAAPAFAKMGQRAGVEIVKQGASPASTVEGILAGLTADSYPLLVTTADHPLLSEDMIVSLIEQTPRDADISVGLADAASVMEAWPQSIRTVTKLGGVGYCGCNLFLLQTPRAMGVVRFWRHMERNRKKPWRLIAAAGIPTLWRYLRGTLDLIAAFNRLSRITGAVVHPVLLPQPEAAIDVDKPEDIALVELILERRSNETR
jgi:GTP:adenosylcobinamide-phosphate guanylyltransferase